MAWKRRHRYDIERLEPRALLATWDGGGLTNDWSDRLNWVGDTIPTPGADLDFPASAPQRTNFNDLFQQPNYNQLRLSGDGYDLQGSFISLLGGITATNPAGTNTINQTVQLAASQVFRSAVAGTLLDFSAGVLSSTHVLDLNGFTLTLNGAGDTTISSQITSGDGSGAQTEIIKNGSGTATLNGNNFYFGATVVNNGTLIVNGDQPVSNVQVNGGVLGGNGRIGPLLAQAGTVSPGLSPGVLSVAGNVVFQSAASYFAQLNGTSPGSASNQHDQLIVRGTVDLGSAALGVTLGFTPASGDSFTIIDNDGTDAVVGTFAGLPEGATILVGSQALAVSYRGGDGNDVSLTAIPTLFVSDASVIEGNSGTSSLVFTVTLVGSLGQTVTVDIASADDTATLADNDYVQLPATRLVFAPGTSSQTVTVAVRGDMTIEQDETLFVNLSGAQGATIVDPQGVGTIVNDDVLTPLQLFVSRVYIDVLRRLVDPGGLAFWTTLLATGTSRTDVAIGIQQSVEYLSLVANDLYIQYLHRPVDPAGLQEVIAFLSAGGEIEVCAAVLVGSDEYLTLNGGTDAGVLAGLYMDALERPIDPAGLAFFTQLLATRFNRRQVGLAVLASKEYRQNLVDGFFQDYLLRPADPIGLQFYLAALAQGASDQEVAASIIGSIEYFNRP